MRHNVETGKVEYVDYTYGEWAAWRKEKAATRAETAQRETDENTIRTRVTALAESAVGVAIDQLTAPQRNALIAVILWKAGGLNPDGTVKPLDEWGR